MRNLLKSTGIAGIILAAGIGLAGTASAGTWVSVGDSWGWHHPYAGWGPYWGWRPAPLYVPERVYVPEVHGTPRLNYVLGELGNDAARIHSDQAAGSLSAANASALIEEDSSIRSQVIRAEDAHGWLPDSSYYHLQSEIEGLNHDISHLVG